MSDQPIDIYQYGQPGSIWQNNDDASLVVRIWASSTQPGGIHVSHLDPHTLTPTDQAEDYTAEQAQAMHPSWHLYQTPQQ